jgi:hypothetical protein
MARALNKKFVGPDLYEGMRKEYCLLRLLFSMIIPVEGTKVCKSQCAKFVVT